MPGSETPMGKSSGDGPTMRPEDRFASCGAVVAALEAHAVGSRVPRDRAGGPRPVAALKGILAAAILAALAGGGWWFVNARAAHSTGTTGVPPVAAAKAKAERERVKAAHKGIRLWEGGPYWADRNIGAERPEDYGYYFWWGDTVGYKRVNNAWVASDGSSPNFQFGEKNTPTFGKSPSELQNEGWITASGVLAPEHDAAYVQWGGGWRMPTYRELDDLNIKCDWKWTTVNGVQGYEVRGRGTYASVCIFLPCAGFGHGTSLNGSGSRGYYWSSVPDSDYRYAYGLYFNSGNHGTRYYSRFDGFSVRPVQEFAK